MTVNYTFLPGISKIYTVPCSDLPKYIIDRNATGLPVAVLTELTPLDFVGHPTCKRSTETQNNGELATIEVQFNMRGRWAPPTTPTALIVSTAAGETFLLGTYEAPYPAITVEETTGTPSGDARQTTVSAKLTASVGLIPVII